MEIQIKSSLTDVEADDRTDAELMRDRFFRNGRWHGTNNAELPQSRALLLEGIERWEQLVTERSEIKDAKQKAYDAASLDLRAAANDLSAATEAANIYKMALADEMGILR